jgi:UDP-glucose:glycoprotein glucosyltransferase
MTKEPKLERAKRILPEWEGLDNEMTALAKRVAAAAKAVSNSNTMTSTTSVADKDEL